MATLFVRHSVKDYDVWRKGFDAFQTVARQHGAKSGAVYQEAGNPNDVTVTHDFDSVEAAQSFAQIKELKKAMAEAGVVGAPTIWIANKA